MEQGWKSCQKETSKRPVSILVNGAHTTSTCGNIFNSSTYATDVFLQIVAVFYVDIPIFAEDVNKSNDLLCNFIKLHVREVKGVRALKKKHELICEKRNELLKIWFKKEKQIGDGQEQLLVLNLHMHTRSHFPKNV